MSTGDLERDSEFLKEYKNHHKRKRKRKRRFSFDNWIPLPPEILNYFKED